MKRDEVMTMTSITQAIMQLARPTEAAQGLIDELGYSSGVAMVQEIGFAEALKQVMEGLSWRSSASSSGSQSHGKA